MAFCATATRQGTPPPFRYSERTVWPGPFGATMKTSRSGRASIRRKWMLRPWREGDRRALAHVGVEVVVVELRLQLVGRQHHDDVGPLRRLGRRDTP